MFRAVLAFLSYYDLYFFFFSFLLVSSFSHKTIGEHLLRGSIPLQVGMNFSSQLKKKKDYLMSGFSNLWAKMNLCLAVGKRLECFYETSSNYAQNRASVWKTVFPATLSINRCRTILTAVEIAEANEGIVMTNCWNMLRPAFSSQNWHTIRKEIPRLKNRGFRFAVIVLTVCQYLLRFSTSHIMLYRVHRLWWLYIYSVWNSFSQIVGCSVHYSNSCFAECISLYRWCMVCQ